MTTAPGRSRRTLVLALAGGGALVLAFALGRCSSSSPPEPREAATAGTDRRPASGAGEGMAMSPDQLRSAGIELIRPERSGGSERPISGFVETSAAARSTVGVPLGGRVQRLLVAPGDEVVADEPIAELISPEAAAIRAEVEAAGAGAKTVEGQYRRLIPLAKKGYVPWQELENKRLESVRASSEARAALARVRAAGSPDRNGRVLLRSPGTGSVTAVQVAAGSVVQPGDVIAEISDPAGSELRFRVSPAVAETLAVGQVLRVRSGQREFRARVSGIAPDAAATNRATVVRARPIDADLPPAGTPVTAFPVVPAAAASFTVPSDAVQTLAGSPVVFRVENGLVRPLPVVIGRQADGRTEILEGLKGGETLAGTNTYLLKTELEQRRQ